MTAFVAALLLALVCWVSRVLLVAVIPADRLPGWVQDSLQHLAPAVMASLVAVSLVGTLRGTDVGPALLILAGVGVAFVVVRRTRSVSLSVAVGVVTALLVDLVLL